MTHLTLDNWDFETGDLSFWTAEGDAFKNQPICGDTITTARVRPVTLGGDYWDVPYPIGHHDNYWVGTAENPLGDAATGTLTSQEFPISGRYIHFLVSGTRDPRGIRVELQIRIEDYERIYWYVKNSQRGEDGLKLPSVLGRDNGFVVVLRTTGHNNEVMRQESWDVAADWMSIAYSSLEARQIISEGKLAVVLGVEVDRLGGWKLEEDCTDTQVATLLQMLYAQGIHMMTPIHLVDNAFGGCAIYDTLFNGLDYYLNGEYYDVEDGYDSGVQFRLQERPEKIVFERQGSGSIKKDSSDHRKTFPQI